MTNSLCNGQEENNEPINFEEFVQVGWVKNSDYLSLQAKSKTLSIITLITENRNSANKTFVLKPNDSVILYRHKRNKNDSSIIKQFSDYTKISYYLGNESFINPDKDYKYRLPYKKGKSYEVIQSFNGSFSHQTLQSKYAIDFSMKINEPIYAARDGLVVKVIVRFDNSGGEEMRGKANKIIIQHSDGTMAYYAHLKNKGAIVKEGDMVKRGQKIGFSGNTGYSTKPHLHFVVRREQFKSIPIYFSGYENIVLQKGKKYKIKE